jgi:hypothetical protein
VALVRRGKASNDELGWWLGFHYLWIKIRRRTGTIYIGLLVPTHRGLTVLMILSPNRL